MKPTQFSVGTRDYYLPNSECVLPQQFSTGRRQLYDKPVKRTLGVAPGEPELSWALVLYLIRDSDCDKESDVENDPYD